MAVLTAAEYDAYYFEGKTQTYTHNAGYGSYSRMQWNRHKAGYGFTLEESTGTFFGDLMKSANYTMNGVWNTKNVLVLGCAYGFEVKELRDLGIIADGIDVSSYAISQADSSVAPFLSVQNALTYLPTLARNAYDYIFSRWFLECLSDSDLAILLPEMKRVAKSGQMHIMSSKSPSEYYNIKTLAEWQALDWGQAVNAVLMLNDDFANHVIG